MTGKFAKTLKLLLFAQLAFVAAQAGAGEYGKKAAKDIVDVAADAGGFFARDGSTVEC